MDTSTKPTDAAPLKCQCHFPLGFNEIGATIAATVASLLVATVFMFFWRYCGLIDGQSHIDFARISQWIGKLRKRFLRKVKKKVHKTQSTSEDPVKTKENKEKQEEAPAEKKRRPVELQTETFADIIPFIRFTSLASGLALVNHQLHSLCAPKLYEDNRRFVNMMAIEYKDGDDEEENEKSKKKEKQHKVKIRKCQWDSEFSELVEIPIAEVKPPPNILGFRRIFIFSINDQVLHFLRIILPLLEGDSRGVSLTVEDKRSRSSSDGKFRFQQILDMHTVLRGPIVKCLCVSNYRLFDPYWKHCHPFLHSIQFLTLDNGRIYETECVPVLVRWLQTKRDDEKPRYFYSDWSGDNTARLVERLRTSFTTALETSTYIVELDTDDQLMDADHPPPAPFTERNGLNERLVLSRHRHRNSRHQTLVLRRFPALAAAIGDEWMEAVLEGARHLMASHITMFKEYSMEQAEGNGREEEAGPRNEIIFSPEWECSFASRYR